MPIWPLVGLRTQTQTPRFLTAKDLNASPGPEGSLQIAKTIAMAFFFTLAFLERKSLNGNLSWGFPLGNLLPKTPVLKHRVLERKRRPNANASVSGTQRFRTQRFGRHLANRYQ